MLLGSRVLRVSEAGYYDALIRPPSARSIHHAWLTVTEHPTGEGEVFYAVVLDARSRRLVVWSIDASPTAALATDVLGVAIDSPTPPSGTVITPTGACSSAPGRCSTASAGAPA